MNPKELFYELWNWRQKQLEKIKQDNTIYFDIFDDTVFQPTQGNKLTPHSHLTKNDLWFKLKKSFPSKEGYEVYFVANTNSMEPFIDDNCLVVMSDNLTDIKPGDIAIWYYAPRNLLIIHRILQINDTQTQFFFKGDNNFSPDGWIPLELIQRRLVVVAYGKSQRKDD